MKKYIRIALIDDNDIDNERDKGITLEDGKTQKLIALQDNPRLPSGVSIGPKMVEDFIAETHISTVGDKTTLVRVVLQNGFEIIESSGCVDKANYSEEIGAQACMSKIKDKIWYLLGFLLQTAVCGNTTKED